MQKQWIGLFVVVLTAAMPSSSTGTTRIDPSNPKIQYMGRWNFDNPSKPWVAWKSSTVLVRFKGTAISGEFDAGSRTEQFRVIIDGVPNVQRLYMARGRKTYVLATGLSNGLHVVEIMKETFYGTNTTFHGFDITGTIESPPTRSLRRIEFFGDSNMDGTSLYSEQNSGDHGSYYAFPATIGRMLGAAINDESVGGATLTGSGDNNVGSFIFSENYYDQNSSYRSGFKPNVIVINAGANDINRAGKATIKNRYKSVIADLRKVYGTTPHIVLFNAYGWDLNEPANYTQEVVSEVGGNISVCLYPWMWEKWHGSMVEHSGEARILADHIVSLGQGFAQQKNPEVFDGFGRNFDVANGSFEDLAASGFKAFGWRYQAVAGVDRIFSPTGAAAGSYYLRLTQGRLVHQGTDATGDMAPGGTAKIQKYTVTAKIRSSLANAQAQILADFERQSLYQRRNGQAETFKVTASWQTYTATFAAPIGTWKTYVSLKAAVGTIEFDDVKMAQGGLPPGVTVFGSSSPGCRGPLGISVTSSPKIGNAAFAIHCANTPTIANGWIIMGADALNPPFSVLGVDLLVDPNGAFFLLLPVKSRATGVSSVVASIPRDSSLVGLNVKSQFVWQGPASPPPCPLFGLSSSNALSITIQS